MERPDDKPQPAPQEDVPGNTPPPVPDVPKE